MLEAFIHSTWIQIFWIFNPSTLASFNNTEHIHEACNYDTHTFFWFTKKISRSRNRVSMMTAAYFFLGRLLYIYP